MTDTVIFIDANQYLRLFGVKTGRKLLDLLDAQRKRVFVTRQIADEVLRNKLKLTQQFFRKTLEELADMNVSVPDHLLGIDDDKLKELRKAFSNAELARVAIRNLAVDVLRTMSKSADDVSQRLRPLFDGAVKHAVKELARARDRHERGNPPGKPNDPLGDQISWEQLLTVCRKTRPGDIWLVTGDTDYLTKFGDKLFLNPFLSGDLIEACQGQPEVHCFDDLLDGLTAFAKTVGVKAEKLPTVDEAQQIRKEADIWIANTAPLSASTRITGKQIFMGHEITEWLKEIEKNKGVSRSKAGLPPPP